MTTFLFPLFIYPTSDDGDVEYILLTMNLKRIFPTFYALKDTNENYEDFETDKDTEIQKYRSTERNGTIYEDFKSEKYRKNTEV